VAVPIGESLAGGTHTASFALGDATGTTISLDFAVAAVAAEPTPAPTPEPTETVIPTTPATTSPAVPGASGGSTGHLAATGVDATPAFAAGIAALLLGLGMTVARLRRRTAAK